MGDFALSVWRSEENPPQKSILRWKNERHYVLNNMRDDHLNIDVKKNQKSRKPVFQLSVNLFLLLFSPCRVQRATMAQWKPETNCNWKACTHTLNSFCCAFFYIFISPALNRYRCHRTDIRLRKLTEANRFVDIPLHLQRSISMFTNSRGSVTCVVETWKWPRCQKSMLTENAHEIHARHAHAKQFNRYWPFFHCVANVIDESTTKCIRISRMSMDTQAKIALTIPFIVMNHCPFGCTCWCLPYPFPFPFFTSYSSHPTVIVKRALKCKLAGKAFSKNIQYSKLYFMQTSMHWLRRAESVNGSRKASARAQRKTMLKHLLNQIVY